MKNNTKNAKVIALYLPQYHPTKENDEWWGKGFTEWTNVGKAKSLFKSHYQPRVPAELGYYDLRMAESRIAQAKLAEEHGVDGFCYYHYWFGNGKRLLNKPFDEVLRLKEPDFPFMLCWANESWHRKFWNHEGVSSKEVLIEQTYGDNEEIKAHFFSLLKAFQDGRYIRIDDKPAFMIYRPLEIPEVENFIAVWEKLAKENGLNGIHFIGHSMNTNQEYNLILEKGFSAINSNRIMQSRESAEPKNVILKILSKGYRSVFNLPFVLEYDKALKVLKNDFDKDEKIYPSIVPNWDHTPRSGNRGFLYQNSTPEKFAKHVNQIFELLNQRKDNKICFIKSWNEWGEGNYMEPDLRFERKYLEVLKKEREEFDI